MRRDAASWGSARTEDALQGVVTGDAATEQRRLKPGWLKPEVQGGDLLGGDVALSTPKTAEKGLD